MRELPIASQTAFPTLFLSRSAISFVESFTERSERSSWQALDFPSGLRDDAVVPVGVKAVRLRPYPFYPGEMDKSPTL